MRTILCTLGLALAAALLGGCTESDDDPAPVPATPPSPTVSGVTPASGDVAGGITITIDGTNFLSGATVAVGGAAATGVTFVTSTQLTATLPAGSQGAAAVLVTNPTGASATLTGGFTYTSGGTGPTPTLTAVSPSTGPVGGGQAVTLTGSGFQAGATVDIGGAQATSVVVVSGATITAVTPAGTVGAVNVVVTNTDATTVTLTGGYTYAAVPTVSSVSPNTGDVLGGTAVTITGTNFATGATADFGGAQAGNVVVASSTTITANTPAGAAGAVTVTVTNPSSLSGALASAFTYTSGGTQPTVSNVAPATGPWAGGTTLTVTGSNFISGASVTIGGVAATGVTFVNSTELTCTSPAAAPGTAGVQPVTVTNPAGAGATNTSPGFTYTSLAVEALSDTAADADVAIDGAGTIHVVWQRTTSVPATDIMYVRSTNGGRTWSTPTGLDLTSNAVSRPRIAASGNNVIVVWNEVSSTQDVRRVESTNNGTSWSSISTVNSGSVRPDPDVAVIGSGGYVIAYLVYGGIGPQSSTYQHVYTVRGAFGGPMASAVGAQTGGIICYAPAVATAGTNNLYITYHQTTTFGPTVAGSGNIDLSLVRSTDGGVSYATPQVVANDANDHLYPSIVATGTTVVLTRLVSSAVMVPQVGLNWSWRIETLRSTDSGVSFSTGALLASGSGSSSSRVGSALDGSGGITACWRAANDIFSARSTDGGATFATAVNLSSNAGVSQRPQVAGGTGSQVVHVWTDDTASTGTFDVLSR